MKKTVFFLLIIIIIFTGCQRERVIKTHGLAYLDKREKLIVINKSNKNDAIKILGQPATRGMTNDNLWIYIERTRTRGNLMQLGKSYLKKSNVLVLEFNKYGVLRNKKFYDKENLKNITFAKAVTENDIRRENFVFSFLSSIRQKMDSKRK